MSPHFNTAAKNKHILIVDDDKAVRVLVRHALQKAGFSVLEAADGEKAKSLLNEEIAVALLDINLPGTSGLDCLGHIKSAYEDISVIMLSALEDIETVVQSMKLGAFWYLPKSSIGARLMPLVEQAYKHHQLALENRLLRSAIEPSQIPLVYAGSSRASTELLERAQRLAALDSSILISGESGTGKSMLARLIHELGPRSKRPFVMVSCAALPRDLLEAELFGHERGAFTGAVQSRAGKIEVADGGTLFLDEIGDMPLELQPKLLAFLQERLVQRLGSNKEKKADVRVITATHQNLSQMCSEGSFREDLFFRINVLSLDIPPLRARKEDIPAIAKYHLEQICRSRGVKPLTLSRSALDALLAYEWPGNVRELENVIERAYAFSASSEIRAEDLSFSLLPHKKAGSVLELLAADGNGNLAGKTLSQLEKKAILDTLRKCQGNKALAARMLGISEKSIYNKIERLKITEEVREICSA